MNNQEFDIWVKNSVSSLMQAVEGNQRICYSTNYKDKVCMIVNRKTGKVAVAKCSPDDVFNDVVGLAIAWARYMNRPIPVVSDFVSLHTLNTNDIFIYKSKKYRLLDFVGALGSRATDKMYVLVISLSDDIMYCMPGNTLVIKTI